MKFEWWRWGGIISEVAQSLRLALHFFGGVSRSAVRLLADGGHLGSHTGQKGGKAPVERRPGCLCGRMAVPPLGRVTEDGTLWLQIREAGVAVNQLWISRS